MNAPELTAADINMLSYFWNQKGDLERWVGWDRVIPSLAEHHPEVLKAWDDYHTSRRTMTDVINDLL